MLRMAKKVAFIWWESILNAKNPLYEPSLHCKSWLMPTRTWEIGSALAGVTPAPKGEEEVTAVPPNSTPMAPLPETGSYLDDVRFCFFKETLKKRGTDVVVSLGSRGYFPILSYEVCRIISWLTSEVRHPVSMRVSRENDSVVDVIVIEMVQDTISVGSVSIPCVLNQSEN